MTQSDLSQTIPKPTNFMLYIGGLMFAGLLIYFAFTAVNSLGLKEQSATARVIVKDYKEAGSTYVTQKVGNRILTIPQSQAEMYLLGLDVQGKSSLCAVAKTVYDRLNIGDQVEVVFRRKRVTGSVEVLSVMP
jgi:hypothetical protein